MTTWSMHTQSDLSRCRDLTAAVGAVLYHAVQYRATLYRSYGNKERGATSTDVAHGCDPRGVMYGISVGLIRLVARVACNDPNFARLPRETVDSSTNHNTRTKSY